MLSTALIVRNIKIVLLKEGKLNGFIYFKGAYLDSEHCNSSNANTDFM